MWGRVSLSLSCLPPAFDLSLLYSFTVAAGQMPMEGGGADEKENWIRIRESEILSKSLPLLVFIFQMKLVLTPLFSWG